MKPMFTPKKVAKMLSDMGSAFKLARLKRKWTVEETALRAKISKQTYMRAERGDDGVSIGTIFRLSWLFGLDRIMFDHMFDPKNDVLGEQLVETVHLPKRVRKKKDE